MNQDVSDASRNPPEEPLAYCVVANVAAETAHGEGGLDIRAGTRHFAAGAKVWVLPPQWGDGGEKLMVVGRHRGSAGPYVRMVVARTHLTNFRVKPVYSSQLLRVLTRPLAADRGGTPRLWDSGEEAEAVVSRWQRPMLPARFDDTPFSAQVDDPPPAELQHRGKTYHLAHFNARRARYSAQPPPTEPPTAAGD